MASPLSSLRRWWMAFARGQRQDSSPVFVSSLRLPQQAPSLDWVWGSSSSCFYSLKCYRVTFLFKVRNKRQWVVVLARAFSASCLIRRLWFSCLCKWRDHCPHYGAGGWLSRGAIDKACLCLIATPTTAGAFVGLGVGQFE